MAKKTVELVSPDGERKRTVHVNSKDDTALRWEGWQAAPEAEAPKPQAQARRTEPTA